MDEIEMLERNKDILMYQSYYEGNLLSFCNNNKRVMKWVVFNFLCFSEWDYKKQPWFYCTPWIYFYMNSICIRFMRRYEVKHPKELCMLLGILLSCFCSRFFVLIYSHPLGVNDTALGNLHLKIKNELYV